MILDSHLLVFLTASVLLTLTPGPDNLMVLSMGMAKGRREGVAFGLGCGLGCLSHTLLAVLGVSALVAASPFAFTALKWAGAGYLLRLGIGAMQSTGNGGIDARHLPTHHTPYVLFRKGLLANAINPKVVLFFLSFLPQFVVPSQGQPAQQMGLLGLVFTAQAVIIFALLGYYAGAIGQWLKQVPGAAVWLDRGAGLLFIGLALRLVLA